MLNERLKELRKQKKVTQQDVANYLGITRPAYTAYEKGSRNPDYDLLNKLARYFNVTTDYLLGTDTTKTKDSTEPELTTYQQEVLDFFNSREDLFFHDHPGDIRQALEQFEIYYEVWKRQQEKKKN